MKKTGNALTLISIIVIACSLRATITGIGPLTSMIRQELGLSASLAGMITTLPLLAFALVSFLTSPLSRRFGAGRIILIALVVSSAGILIRSFLGTPGLFLGTILIGLGIGINNVLLPAVTKARFPQKMGTITGTYTTFMAGFASLSVGISVPLALAFGTWRLAVLIWIVVTVAAIILWFPNRNMVLTSSQGKEEHMNVNLKRRHVASFPITWYLTLYMGLQSLIFYFTVAWFSTILQSQGYTQTTSGILNMAMMLCGLPGSFVMPIIAVKTRHQSFWGAFIGLLYTIGIVSLLFAWHPLGLVITILSNGFGSGSCIAYIMVMFGLHSKDAEDASAVSSFAQGIGYIIGAVGPVLVGKIFDASGNWTAPLLVLMAIGVATIIFGWLSGLNRVIDTKQS